MPQLTDTQIQAIQQKLQASPDMAKPVMDQLVSQGYDIPQQLQQYSGDQSSPSPDDGSTKIVPSFATFTPTGDNVKDTGSALLSGVANLIPSAINDVGGIVVHPIKTAENIGGLIKNLALPPMPGSDPLAPLKGMWSYFTSKYGSYQNILNSVGNDPAGVALDMSVLLDGAGSLFDAAKIGTVGADAADVAEAAGKVAPTSLGEKLKTAAGYVNPLTAPFKVAGSVLGGGADASSVEAAAARQGAKTGIDINSSFTAGMKGGQIQKVIEGVASFLPGAGKMVERFTNAWTAVNESMVNFGKNITDAFSGAGETPESIVKSVGSKVQEAADSTYAAASKLFGKFRDANGDVPVDVTKPFVPTAVDDAPAVSVNGVLDNVLNNNSIAYSKGLRSLFQEFSDSLTGGAEATTPEDFAKSQIGLAGVAPANITDDMVQKYIEENPDLVNKATGGAEDGAEAGKPNFGQLYNISDRISTEFSKFSGKDVTAVSALRDAIHSTLGDALTQADPKLGEAWQTLKQSYGAASKTLGDSTYRALTSANVQPTTLLEKFFGRRATSAGLDGLQNVVGQSNFYDMGRAYLLNQVLPAFSDQEVVDKVSGIGTTEQRFNSTQFMKNISKTSDARWQQILDPATYQRLTAFKADASDFETILKEGMKGAKAFSEGSRTTPMYRVLRYISPATEGIGLALAGGASLATGGITTGLSLLFGDLLFSKLVGSDLGQKLLSGSVVGKNVLNVASKIGGSGALRAATAVTADVNDNANKQLQQGTALSPQQTQAIQTQIQQHPEQTQAIKNQLVAGGYAVPDFLNGQ